MTQKRVSPIDGSTVSHHAIITLAIRLSCSAVASRSHCQASSGGCSKFWRSIVSLYGAFFVKEFAERQICCLSSVSLFDLKARFFVPTRGSLTSSRAGAVKVGRRANLAACSELARPRLDSFEHDGMLCAIGMTIRGEPAFGRGSVAPQPCIRWVQGPEP